MRRPKHGQHRRKHTITPILGPYWGKPGLLKNSNTGKRNIMPFAKYKYPEGFHDYAVKRSLRGSLQGSLCRNRQALPWRKHHSIPTAWLWAWDFLCAEKKRRTLNFNMSHFAWLQCEATTPPWLFSHIPWVRKDVCYGLLSRQETEESSQMRNLLLCIHSGRKCILVYWHPHSPTKTGNNALLSLACTVHRAQCWPADQLLFLSKPILSTEPEWREVNTVSLLQRLLILWFGWKSTNVFCNLPWSQSYWIHRCGYLKTHMISSPAASTAFLV